MTSIESALFQFGNAALAPATWGRSLDRIAAEMRSVGATLVLGQTRRDSIAVSTSIGPFVDEYMRLPVPDPREARVRPRLDQAFVTDKDIFSAQELARDPYYQEFLRPRGFGWNATAALTERLFISFKRGDRFGPFAGSDLDALNRLLPYLRAMSRIASCAWRSGYDGELRSFERVGCAALLLDRRGRICASNGVEPYGDGLDVVGGCLRAARPDDQSRLRRFVARLVDSGADSADEAAMLRISRAINVRPLILDGIRRVDALRSLHSEAVAMVIITDLARPRRVPVLALGTVFGLTMTEARLAAAIGDGLSLRQAAASLRISEAHARQRLKRIFDKTGTSGQAQLAGVLGRLSIGLPR